MRARAKVLMRALAIVAVLAVVAAACTGGGKTPSGGGSAGLESPVVQAPSAPPPAVQGLWAKPPIGDSWADYFGIELEATLDHGGSKVLDPKPGDLYFYTNSGTGWGATNTRNSVVVFDATDMLHWKPLAVTHLPPQYSVGYSSHGATVSADGRWIYLQAMGSPDKPPRLIVIDGLTLKPYKVYRETLGGFGGHHLNNFTGPDGHEYIMNVDFNWNWGGAGAWVLDPSKDQAIVGGMNRQDFSGNPYVLSGDIQGKFMFATVPAPSAALRGKMEGYLAKIDLTTWKIVGATPVPDPIWPEVTQDGKFAWVTEGDGQKVMKIDLETMQEVAEVSTGPGPWGARLSCDESKLYVADKGESAGYAQQGRTMTVIDTKFNIVTNVVPIGRTTDHIILSPDCKYVLANSNADHGIWIIDAETEKVVSVVKMPNDGDPHGGTFVQWRSDGKGGVVGEVVSTLTGLRGSAREAQQQLIERMQQAVTVQVNPKSSFFGTPTSFTPESVTVAPGAKVTFLFVYASGTSGPLLSFAGPEATIGEFDLAPGQRELITFTAPSKPTTFQVTVPGDDAAKPLTVVVEESEEEGTTEEEAAEVHDVNLVADGLKWDIKTLTLKAGETVRITIVNNDDEVHDLINRETGLVSPASPDVSGGQTTSFEWKAPSTKGQFKFFCQYHPWMIIDVTIQ
ncbi:MAG: cupredoxin domain-containing protein [Actinobacteria bacterium]|nr:cupredoxin domain-containing protein [Actinomycetota bacterium]